MPQRDLSLLPAPMPFHLPPVRSIAIASGKGGVGKTCVAVNLSVALTLSKRRTLLLDSDLGLANVDVLLNLMPRLTTADVLAGHCELRDAVIEHATGLFVLPGASGSPWMADLKAKEHAGLVSAVSELELPIEQLVVDNAAGIADGVLTYCQAVHDVVLVINDDPSSITDTYAMIKVLTRDRAVKRFQIISNRVATESDGRRLHRRLQEVTERFIPEATLNYLGFVPNDPTIYRAMQMRQSVVAAFPNSPAARAFNTIAQRVMQWAPPAAPTGNLEFFMERLLPHTEVAA